MAGVPGPARCLALAVLLAVTAGCSAAVPDGTPPPSAAAAAPTTTAPPPTTTPVGTAATDPVLRDELLAMLAADQADRAEEEPDIGAERGRTERLRQIVAERGWPTRTLVGADGATAAWAIAQHSDLDEQFQRQALELMRQAVAAGEADPGELAYLVDRVAANAGQPQTYGTQMGCGEDGRPQLAPLAEPDRVDQLRAEAGLPPLADYLAELAEVCASS
jgi:uncharacterized protein DUF6624